jgi:hypothetical protein
MGLFWVFNESLATLLSDVKYQVLDDVYVSFCYIVHREVTGLYQVHNIKRQAKITS